MLITTVDKDRIKALKIKQYKRYFQSPLIPIKVVTVKDQCSLAEYGSINDRIGRELDDVQRKDMKDHCKSWTPHVIPENMVMPVSAKLKPAGIHALFNEINSYLP